MTAIGQFPPSWAPASPAGPAGLVLTAAVAMILAAGFDLSSIASIGSAIALTVFTLVRIAHLRVRDDTGAKAWLLILAITSTVIVLLTFIFTTLVHEPATAVTLAVTLAISIGLDLGWKRSHAATGPRRPG
jgi:L-asparagine transporter-like permease